MQYRCLIVDDERPALKLLTAYLEKIPHLELVAACENGMEAMGVLQREHVDILFLDIQMPDFTGLDLLRSLQRKPQVILTTAYRDYAVEGFALSATDYLVKPFSLERFLQGVNKAIEQIKLKQTNVDPIIPKATDTTAADQPEDDHFFVRTNYKMEKIVFADIQYVESMREYVAIHTHEKRYVIHQTMTNMEKELPATMFMRIHRSYIVNTKLIKGVNGNQVIIADQQLTIGASYRQTFFDSLRTL